MRAVRRELEGIIETDRLIVDPVELAAYDCDGLTHFRARPGLVVLCDDPTEVRAVVKACARRAVPFVARGSGTGLSGGALPRSDGVLIVLSRMRAILEVRAADERAVVEPGVTNLAITQAVHADGLYYAPDPSSQQICSIGGNVAENSGGAHCLKYGFTVNHVTGLDLVAPDGEQHTLGGDAPDAPGYDLLGVVVGGEGMLGVVTSVTVRLTGLPEQVRTFLVGFDSIEDAGRATSFVIEAGIVPAAIELMDAVAVEAAEAAVACGYPPGAAAVLVIELDGPAVTVEAEVAAVRRLCDQAGATSVRLARDDEERATIWRGRKSAFAAVGRISPSYLVQDGVVPRSALPEVLADIARLSREYGLRVANVFHAGDGNLHPLVLFDDAVTHQRADAESLAGDILRACVARGGSITGEHGVGIEKVEFMGEMFSEDDLLAMEGLRAAFDPARIANPGKVLPVHVMCGEARRPGLLATTTAGDRA